MAAICLGLNVLSRVNTNGPTTKTWSWHIIAFEKISWIQLVPVYMICGKMATQPENKYVTLIGP